MIDLSVFSRKFRSSRFFVRVFRFELVVVVYEFRFFESARYGFFEFGVALFGFEVLSLECGFESAFLVSLSDFEVFVMEFSEFVKSE